jgi:hypothetical protein
VGKVIDEDLSPLPFVNVVLLSEKDSSFVKGTTTKENGDFCIKEPDIEKNFFMRISCVGYFTQHLHSIQSDSLYILFKICKFQRLDSIAMAFYNNDIP